MTALIDEHNGFDNLKPTGGINSLLNSFTSTVKVSTNSGMETDAAHQNEQIIFQQDQEQELLKSEEKYKNDNDGDNIAN